MPRHDFKTLFPDEMLVAYANQLLEEAGSRLTVTGVKETADRWIRFEAKGPRGKAELVAPFGMPRSGTIFFRSILKVQDPARGGSWLINGQASTGTSEIAFYGENGTWLATSLDRLRAYLESGKEGTAAERAAEFDDWVESQIAVAVTQGLVRERAETINWQKDGERVTLEDTPPSAPSPA